MWLKNHVIYTYLDTYKFKFEFVTVLWEIKMKVLSCKKLIKVRTLVRNTFLCVSPFFKLLSNGDDVSIQKNYTNSLKKPNVSDSL